MTNYPDFIGAAQKLLAQQAEINDLKAKLAALEAEVPRIAAQALRDAATDLNRNRGASMRNAKIWSAGADMWLRERAAHLEER